MTETTQDTIEYLDGEMLPHDLGRVLINAQIAAPAFLSHNHRLSKKCTPATN